MARGEWAVILRGAEVLDFVGWNILEEGGSKKEEKKLPWFAYHVAHKSTLVGTKLRNPRIHTALPACLAHSRYGGKDQA